MYRKHPSEQHNYDYRPRFKHRDHKRIQDLALELDMAPNTLVRVLARKALDLPHNELQALLNSRKAA